MIALTIASAVRGCSLRNRLVVARELLTKGTPNSWRLPRYEKLRSLRGPETEGSTMVASILPLIRAWARVGSSPMAKNVRLSRFSSSPKCLSMRKEARCEELPKLLMANVLLLRSSARLISGLAQMS